MTTKAKVEERVKEKPSVWTTRRAEALKVLGETHKALNVFNASPEGKELKAAQEKKEKTEQRVNNTREAERVTYRDAAIRLGVLKARKVRGVRPFTEKFLAVAAEQIGCTREEAKSMPGGVLQGRRCDGGELYDQFLAVIESNIVAHDAKFTDACNAKRSAQKADEDARHEVYEIETRHRDVLNAPIHAKRAFDTIDVDESTAKSRKKATVRRTADKQVISKEQIAKLADAKKKLFDLVMKHSATYERATGKRTRGAVVEWWKV